MSVNTASQAHSKSSLISQILSFFNGPFVKWFVIFSYGYFFAIILIEVIMRYLFNFSTTWGEMTARYAFVYFAYIAAAEAFRHDEHIRIDFVPSILGKNGRVLLETYIDFLCIVISFCVIWYSISVMQIQLMANIRMHALPLNLSIAEAALPIGWGLMLIRIVQRVCRRFGINQQASEVQ